MVQRLTMPLPRFYKLDATQQDALLDAGAGEFARHGYEVASINRIIADAGISKGALYYYFTDKADLYVAVIGRALTATAAAVGGLAPFDDAEGFWSSVAAFVERLTAAMLGDAQLAALGRSVYEGSSGGVRDVLVDRTAAWVERALADGQRVGAVRADVPLDLLARAVTGLAVAMDRWFAERWENLPAAELAALSPKVIELCRDLLSPKETS